MQEMASDMNKLKRPLLLRIIILYIETISQVTSCKRTLQVGSLRQIHGRTTISPANLATMEQRNGSFKVIFSSNGYHPAQLLCCGFMENVRVPRKLRFRRC